MKALLTSILTIFAISNCVSKLDFENPGDSRSSAFLARSLFSNYLNSLATSADTTVDGEIPQFLAVLMLRGFSSTGVRIYSVDSETGTLYNEKEYLRTPAIGSAPGNSPRRIERIPNTNELLVAAGVADNRLYSFSVSADGTVVPKNSAPAHTKNVDFAVISSDGKKIISATDGTAAPPDQFIRYSRDASSGGMTYINSGGYPFGLPCGPRSIALTPNGTNLFVNTNAGGSSLLGFLDTDGVISQSATTITPAAAFTTNDNLCLHPTKPYLYSTIGLASGPIVGYSYDQNSNLTALPSSPFLPSAGYLGTTGQSNRTLTIDPLGKFVAFLYDESSGKKLQLLRINEETGALTPTNNPVTVGNAPKQIEWDKSGRFLYFISDDLTNFQIEVFRVLKNGSLEKTVNSPYNITSLGGTAAAPIDLISISKTSKVKTGEYP